ncbi:hypothetical protein ACH5RR_016177 [Cinchona calisaya]|uniref:Uncharacterized protein n=1 Tax=Cinchona calisaya TaxID=153742 RepID=A0ABD2ZWE7_9GENT
MDYHKMIYFSLIVLSIAIFIQFAAAAEPLFHVCTINDRVTANSEYEMNLKILSQDLYCKIIPGTGYEYEYEYVTRTNNDTVYGSALCPGDVQERGSTNMSRQCRCQLFGTNIVLLNT